MSGRDRAPLRGIETALDKGLSYLANVQRPDGGFDSYSSPSKTRFKKAYAYQTTFVPALMLAALSGLETPAGQDIRRRLFAFVRAQRSPNWSFNYWAAKSPERKRLPYPDDLDDISCAFIGLTLHDKTSMDPAALAAIVKLLIAAETQPGGPYRTWLVPSGSSARWQDVDLAVNANIAFLLSLISEPLPNVTAFIDQAIRNHRLTSPYYVSEYPLLYYVSRSYQGSRFKGLQAIAKRLHRSNKTLGPLEEATLLTSLLRLNDPDASSLVPRVLEGQRKDGSWPAEAFCLDPARGGKKYYHGSESLTTALALEALNLYRQQVSRSEAAHSAQNNAPTSNVQTKSILRAVRCESQHLAPELRRALRSYIKRTVQTPNGPEIMTLAEHFDRSLIHPLDSRLRPALVRLGLANTYGWAAYTILDDFLDEEGRPQLLPVATTALRYSLNTFEQVMPGDAAFRQCIHRTFDTIDAANAWELAHCRFRVKDNVIVIKRLPSYSDAGKLAERSLGHVLGPLAVLRLGGAELNGGLTRSVRQAFVRYLAARQLNDDLHDWQTDLAKGHITLVVASVLDDLHLKPGRYSLESIMPAAQRQFWHHTIVSLCHTVREQTALGRQDLAGRPQLKRSNVITGLLDRIDASTQETLAARHEARHFLEHYSDKVSRTTK